MYNNYSSARYCSKPHVRRRAGIKKKLMTKKELKDWWDSDEEETSWAESALPMLGFMLAVIILFVAAMLYVAGS
jgi:hypothetical protein